MIWTQDSCPGIYNPPSIKDFPNLKSRSITISDYIHENIGILIGDKGKHFIKITTQHNLLYIWYSENKIILFGENDEDLMSGVRSIIRQIKYMNWKRHQPHHEIVQPTLSES
jgi:hypothetical protein